MAHSTENQHESGPRLHRLPPEDIAALLIGAQIFSAFSLHETLPELAAAGEASAASLIAGGKLGFAGAGSSGLMALAERLELAGTFGIPPETTPICFAGGPDALLRLQGQSEDQVALAEADLDASGLTKGDTIIAVSASGTTPYTLSIARLAHQRGITVIGIANVEYSDLLSISDHAIYLDTGPEVLAGSTRMAAGTAQKIALNTIAVLIGIRLGHVHDGYMVNLQAENAKLVQRAADIVSNVAQVKRDEALTALELAQGEVKTAILVARGRSAEGARMAITRNHGHLEGLLD
ncbi:N-acetylmuramic acid 6-phosphate etherase [Paracoccus tegillarcae]|uniref:N-acetylmuramic acid 6-phosphate etherase n=1 Tax=Paracoccus tegillarcae TaxID=1529068 RepID=A0A2K9ENP5_9RHOB|nr:N-acetylmuramic acid 6-phosphate etherase [Paracoccus tegillarcae]AUH32326.1 N-acetylmuramic acid 6-phosphate etherase [Paracoccus tegillarcae]